jgi:hypothetical protein
MNTSSLFPVIFTSILSRPNSPGEFLWSSYPAFIGKIKTPDWLETGWLLATFGRKKKEAVNNYKAYVEGIEIKALKDPEEDIIGGFILGDIDFVNWVKDTFLLTLLLATIIFSTIFGNCNSYVIFVDIQSNIFYYFFYNLPPFCLWL